MGQSTDAILWYGYAWTNEGAPPWAKYNEDEERIDDGEQDEDDEDARFARVSGFTEKWTEGAGRDYFKRRNAVTETATCEIVHHCSGDCTMYGVAVRGSRKTAWRGSPVPDPFGEAQPEWNAQLASYCALMGIDPSDQKPRWWLASMWS